jgi:hypothetical protein
VCVERERKGNANDDTKKWLVHAYLIVERGNRSSECIMTQIELCHCIWNRRNCSREVIDTQIAAIEERKKEREKEISNDFFLLVCVSYRMILEKIPDGMGP